VGDGGQSRAVGLSHRFPGWAFEGRVFEGLFLSFAGGANSALVALSVCGLGREVALARSHLVYARSLEFSQTHEGVWFPWNGVFVGGVGVEVGPFGDQIRLEDFKSLVWGEVVKLKVRGVNARGEGGLVVPGHVLLDVGEGDEP
jgi:hypothetical protein